MAGFTDSGLISMDAEEAIGAYLRVKYGTAARGVVIAGDEVCIGTARRGVLKAGDGATIKDIRCPGVHVFIADGAIAAGTDVSSAAGGKVQSGTLGAEDLGRAISTTTQDGEQVQVIPHLK